MVEQTKAKQSGDALPVYFLDFINFNADLNKEFLSQQNIEAAYFDDIKNLFQISSLKKPEVLVYNAELKKNDTTWFRQLKAKFKDVPIIVLSSAKTITHARKLLDSGAFMLLRTPINMEELAAMIKRAFEFKSKGKGESFEVKQDKLSKLLELLAINSNMLLEAFEDTFPSQITSYNDFLLQKMIDMISETLQVEIVSLMLIDPLTSRLIMAAQRGLPPAALTAPPKKVGEGIAGRVAETGQPILTEDVSRFRTVKNAPQESQYKTGSFISLPLKVGNRVIGVINVNNKKDGSAFTREDLGLLEVLNVQILLALRNAQLFSDQKNQLRAAQLLNEIDQVIIQESQRERMFDLMVQKARDILECETLLLFMLDESSQCLKICGFASNSSNTIPDILIQQKEGVEGMIVDVKKPVLISNAENDTRISPKIRGMIPTGIRSIAAYPITVAGDVIGIVEAINKVEHPGFSKEDLYLLKRFTIKVFLALLKAK